MQLDHDKEQEPWYTICGTMLLELDLQVTIKGAELWAFNMALANLIGPATIHTDIVGIIHGLWKKDGCIGPQQINICEFFVNYAEKNWDLDEKSL